MKTWIALLRGINVGGSRIVPMKELRELLEANGFHKVRTYIQSGNIVFQAPTRADGTIALLIEKRFGFKPAVLVVGPEELKKAVSDCPYPREPGKSVHFFFMESKPRTVDHGLLHSLKTASEEFLLKGKILYLHAPEGIGRSKLVAKLGRAFPDTTMTARNLNTIGRLMDMA